MQPIVIRPFQRGDREQVTELVNAHIGAVLPGVSVSVNAVMSQLEREPGESIVDPWVSERATLVAIERERVVAAPTSCATPPRSGCRGAPPQPRRDPLARLRARQRRRRRRAAGCVHRAVRAPGRSRARRPTSRCPCPCCYGVPDCWPHLRELLVRGGFRLEGRTEVILAVTSPTCRRPRCAVDGLRCAARWAARSSRTRASAPSSTTSWSASSISRRI